MNVVLSVARYVSPALGRAVLNDDAGAVGRSVGRSVCHSVGQSVLIEYARAGRPSMAMIGMRRRCSWPSRVGCASERKLFFPAQGGGAVRKGGAGLRVELSLRHAGKKTVY